MKNNELTSEQRKALDHARHLAEHGVPLFVAKPAPPNYKGRTAAGFILPKDWQKTKPSADVASRWKPGMALCAVMGHAVDGLDVDTQKGGAASLDGVARPRSYGRQRTPSGGTHDLIAPLGVRSRDGVLPGVDVKAGVDGDGHGFLFLAPTEKKSKTTGEVEAYRWETPPDLTALDNRDTSGDEIGALFYPSRSAPVITAPYDGPAYADLPEHLQKMADAEGDRRVELWRGKMENALDWPEGKADSEGRSWEGLARDAAWSFACLASFPWSGLDVKGAVELFDRSLPDAFAATEECPEKRPDQKLVNKAAERAPVEPPPWDGLAPAGPSQDGDHDGDDSKVAFTFRLRWYLEDHFDMFFAEDDAKLYLRPKRGGRAEVVDYRSVMRATEPLSSGVAYVTGHAREVAEQLLSYTPRERVKPVSLRSDYNRSKQRIVLDLGWRGSGRCVVVTPDGWTVQDAPPPGVVFKNQGRALPEPDPSGDGLEELRNLLRWKPDDPKWLIVKGWLPASLLSTVARPLLGLFGPQGSSKTTTGRFLTSLIDPKPPGALGGGLTKDLRNEETKALNTYMPSWDNITRVSEAVADFLSRLVTGELKEGRGLYSDSDLATFSYRRTGVFTGINAPHGLKSDTYDRFIVVNIKPLTGQRISEGRLEDEWERVQPRALAGVLDLAVEMLKGLPTAKNPENLRMGDYAEALWAIDRSLYDAYADNVRDLKSAIAEGDPFVQTIYRWLVDEGGEWKGEQTEALERASRHQVVDLSPDAPPWPVDARALSQRINECHSLLQARGIETDTKQTTWNGKKGRRVRWFTLGQGASQ